MEGWPAMLFMKDTSHIFCPLSHSHSLGQTMPPTSNALRDIAAYVPQHEQFFPNQTPEEAVEFVANLKLGEDTREGVRKQRISQILDLVGIPQRARNRAIGGTLAGGVVLRGLSVSRELCLSLSFHSIILIRIFSLNHCYKL